MRSIGEDHGLKVKAIAGSYVVLLGWDMDAARIRTDGVLGFSISRKRHEDGEVIWLLGMKTFASVNANPDQGTLVSSFLHPFQTFQWADYTASPDKTYTYTVVARTGAPGNLSNGPSVSLEVTTERVDLGKHAVFFNRGAVASQEYARRFQNKKPEEWGQEAYDWLSRGLIESLEAFIKQADAGDDLFGAFFEFKNKRIYAAL